MPIPNNPINNLNPHTNTPHPDSPIANQWWAGLSFYQQEFILSHYNLPPGPSPYAILGFYHARDELRNHPNWPATVFRSI